MKRLYVHIGTPKTATTSIQHFLMINPDAFYKDGFIFRPMPFEHQVRGVGRKNPPERNGFFLHGVAEGNPDYDPEIQVRDLERGLAVLTDWFREKDNIILSDESIWLRLGKWNFPERLKAYADTNGVEVIFIVYLRPAVSFLDSQYRQRVKTGFFMKPWEDLFPKILPNADYDSRVRILTDVFGEKSMILRKFVSGEWKKEGRTVYDDFMETLGLPLTEQYRIPKEDANESLTHNYTEIKRIANRVENGWPTPKGLFLRNAALHCSQISMEKDPYTFFTPETLNALNQATAEGNRHLARTYTNSDELFPMKELPPAWDPETSGYINDVVLYFGYITYEQQQQIEELKKYSLLYQIRRVFRKIRSFFRRK